MVSIKLWFFFFFALSGYILNKEIQNEIILFVFLYLFNIVNVYILRSTIKGLIFSIFILILFFVFVY